MNDVESISHEENNAKRGTPFGVLVQKLWQFEFLSTLCHDLIISPQPHIINP